MKFDRLREFEKLILPNGHLICYWSALVCADTGDDLQLIKDFESTMIQKKKFTLKQQCKLKNFKTFQKAKKNKVIKSVKRDVRTRSLCVEAAVDGVFK